jgi:hypothetical protein
VDDTTRINVYQGALCEYLTVSEHRGINGMMVVGLIKGSGYHFSQFVAPCIGLVRIQSPQAGGPLFRTNDL